LSRWRGRHDAACAQIALRRAIGRQRPVWRDAAPLRRVHLALGDGARMHRIGPIRDPQRARGWPSVRQRHIRRQAHGAKDLHRAVRHGLDHRDFVARGRGAHLVNHPRGFQNRQARLLDLAAQFGDRLLRPALIGQASAKSLALQRPLAHQRQGQLLPRRWRARNGGCA